jgi:hypothetical protein
VLVGLEPYTTLWGKKKKKKTKEPVWLGAEPRPLYYLDIHRNGLRPDDVGAH